VGLNGTGFFGGVFQEKMEPTARLGKYSAELRDRAVRLLLESRATHPSRGPHFKR